MGVAYSDARLASGSTFTRQQLQDIVGFTDWDDKAFKYVAQDGEVRGPEVALFIWLRSESRLGRKAARKGTKALSGRGYTAENITSLSVAELEGLGFKENEARDVRCASSKV